MSFESLPLHDALIEKIIFDFESSTLTIELFVFLNTSTTASQHRITFKDVNDFRCPRKNEWGPSNSVLETKFSNNEYMIQMQSGDTIIVQASSYEFEQVGL